MPGLQIKDRALDQWVDVERLARPKRDAIVFMGEKIPLFSASNKFPATTHRVVRTRSLEKEKERERERAKTNLRLQHLGTTRGQRAYLFDLFL